MTLEYTSLTLCDEMGSTYNWILISAFAFKLLWYLTLDEVYEETMALHKCIAGKRKRISNSLFTSAAYRRMTIVSRKSIVQWFQLWVEVPAFLGSPGFLESTTDRCPTVIKTCISGRHFLECEYSKPVISRKTGSICC